LASLQPATADLAKPEVFYAGIAYLGDKDYIDAAYPLSRTLNESASNGPVLDQRLRALLSETELKYLTISYQLGNIRQSKSIGMAIALDRELFSTEQYDTGHQFTKFIFDISGQLLFFDFEKMALIDTVPINFAANHTLKGQYTATKEQRLALAKFLYLEGEENFLAAAVEALTTTKINTKDGLRFQLDTINLHQRVLDQMADNRHPEQFKQYLGQYFTAQLSAQHPVSVLPYNRGYGIGNQLPGRFQDGNVFSLQLPEPDFTFTLDVKNFTKKPAKSSAGYFTQAYLTFNEPYRNKTYIAGDYRYGVDKRGIDTAITTDDWAAYEDAIEGLLASLINQLGKPQKNWHKKYARDTNSYAQFKVKQELFTDD
jgi:hypothetical protein